jgi:hypothetical protein
MAMNVRSVVGVGIVLLVAIIGFGYVSLDGLRSLPIVPVQEKAEAESPAPATERVRGTRTMSTIGDTSVVPVDSAADTGAVDGDWTNRFRTSTNYWEFIESAAAEAAEGDARAQFLIAEALGECKLKVRLYEQLYPDSTLTPAEIFQDVMSQSPNASLPAPYIELGRREFMRCAEFFNGDPPILEAIDANANTRDYWLALALDNGDAIAVMQDIYLLAARLDSMPADSATESRKQIQAGISLAIESRDPEALFRLGVLVTYIGSTDAAEGPAWALAACERGYDCSYANPAVGHDCAALGLCSGGESISLNMQQDLGPLYGRAYARSQEILYALEQGATSSVTNSLLARLDLDNN